MKTPTVALSTELETKLGTEPLVIIAIEWASGTVYYADEDIVFGSEGGDITCLGRILELNAVAASVTTKSSARVSSVTVKLDDVDGALKQKWNTERIEGISAHIYVNYDGGTDWDDNLVLMRGYATSDIVWSEGERTLTLSFDDVIKSREVGYKATQEEIPCIATSNEDKPWPLVFGSAVRVPALQVSGDAVARLQNPLYFPYTDPWLYFNDPEQLFEEGMEHQLIYLGRIPFYGYFKDGKFQLGYEGCSVDVQKQCGNMSILLAYTPAEDIHYSPQHYSIVTMNDVGYTWLKPNEFACATDLPLDGTYVTVNQGATAFNEPGGDWMDYVYAKRYESGVYVYTHNQPVAATVGNPVSTLTGAFYAPPIDKPGMPTGYCTNGWAIWLSWQIIKNVRVTLDGQQDCPLVYVPNLYPSERVVEVMAYRTVNGVKTLVPVPSHYFQINLDDDRYAAELGHNCTTVELINQETGVKTALSDYTDLDWEDDIYVSLESTVPHSTHNAVDAIEWVIEECLPELSADPTTFDEVRAKIDGFPCDFAYLQVSDAFALCEEIARQSRCALVRDGSVVRIKYLSELPDADGDKVITVADVAVQTLELGFTSKEDILNRVTIDWRDDYSISDPNEYVYKDEDSIENFGLSEGTDNYFIFGHKELVEITAAWMYHRAANNWRTMQHIGMFNTLVLDPFDKALISLSIVSLNNLFAQVGAVSIDTDSPQVSLSYTLASRAGVSDADGQPTDDPTFWLGADGVITEPTLRDLLEGKELIDYYPVGTGNDVAAGGTGVDPEKDLAQYNIVFTRNFPTAVKRGELYTLSFELRDDRGKKVREDFSATLSLTTDLTDVIQDSSGNTIRDITVSNGSWSRSVKLVAALPDDDGVEYNGVSFYCDPLNDDADAKYTMIGNASAAFNIVAEPVQEYGQTYPAIITSETGGGDYVAEVYDRGDLTAYTQLTISEMNSVTGIEDGTFVMVTNVAGEYRFVYGGSGGGGSLDQIDLDTPIYEGTTLAGTLADIFTYRNDSTIGRNVLVVDADLAWFVANGDAVPGYLDLFKYAGNWNTRFAQL